ncbi:MAG: hypothetical protein L3J31_06475 [Bacteroidales bacterium]|nr:hypothetical protein [Bacteroidales bacterium]
MKKITIFSILFLLLFAMSCGDSDCEKECSSSTTKTSSINPNGDSGLALMMREMFEEGMRMKGEIQEGKKPEVFKKFEEIHKVSATEPEKQASDDFKVFAKAYHQSLESLKSATAEDAKPLFKNMVDACMTCHRSMCPGPMVKIKKLYIRD